MFFEQYDLRKIDILWEVIDRLDEDDPMYRGTHKAAEYLRTGIANGRVSDLSRGFVDRLMNRILGLTLDELNALDTTELEVDLWGKPLELSPLTERQQTKTPLEFLRTLR